MHSERKAADDALDAFFDDGDIIGPEWGDGERNTVRALALGNHAEAIEEEIHQLLDRREELRAEFDAHTKALETALENYGAAGSLIEALALYTGRVIDRGDSRAARAYETWKAKQDGKDSADRTPAASGQAAGDTSRN